MNDKELKEIIAGNLNYYISQTGKTQRDVAKELGYESTTFNTWCVGKVPPPLPKLQHIANYFGCDVSDLLSPGTHKADRLASVSAEEFQLLNAYRSAGEETKDAIRAILHVKRRDKKD